MSAGSSECAVVTLEDDADERLATAVTGAVDEAGVIVAADVSLSMAVCPTKTASRPPMT